MYKPKYIDYSLIKNSNQKNIWTRRSTIFNNLINKQLLVYNGKKFDRILILPEMVGYKIGDFIFTKKRGKNMHKIIKTKKKKK